MREAADVRSIDALKEAKAALIEFREVVGLALSEAHSEVQRTIWWLQHDQARHWKYEIRKRTEKVNQAKSELYRAKLSALDEHNSALDQKRQLARAQHALEDAEQRARNVQKWVHVLEREFMLYRGQCQSLARTIESDVPRGEGKIEMMIDRLDAYVRLQAPQSGPPKAAAPRPLDDEKKET